MLTPMTSDWGQRFYAVWRPDGDHAITTTWPDAEMAGAKGVKGAKYCRCANLSDGEAYLRMLDVHYAQIQAKRPSPTTTPQIHKRPRTSLSSTPSPTTAPPPFHAIPSVLHADRPGGPSTNAPPHPLIRPELPPDEALRAYVAQLEAQVGFIPPKPTAHPISTPTRAHTTHQRHIQAATTRVAPSGPTLALPDRGCAFPQGDGPSP